MTIVVLEIESLAFLEGIAAVTLVATLTYLALHHVSVRWGRRASFIESMGVIVKPAAVAIFLLSVAFVASGESRFAIAALSVAVGSAIATLIARGIWASRARTRMGR